LNPVGQVQVPDAVQTPEPAQGGEQALDWRSRRLREPVKEDEGSWAMSGTEDQRIVRCFEELAETAAQMLEARAKELAVSAVPVVNQADIQCTEPD